MNAYWSLTQYIIMFSEASCDTEDWSNDDTNSILPSLMPYLNNI